VDLLDPSLGSGPQGQVHDLSPGTLPNGLFWTMQLPQDAFEVHRDGRVARLRLRVLPLVDTFVFGGSLAIAAQVNIDVLWRATSDPVERGKGAAVDPKSPAAFTGHFAEASCSGRVSGVETGFSFKTGELTADAFFAEMGRERNGVFLS
jgi:hypothetical protein